MKKLVALTLASLMLLAGCSSTPKNDGNEATPTPEAAATEADVIVVGAGGAGMAAAIQAARTSDLKILLLEKEAYVGGSTALSGGQIAVAGTPKNEGDDVRRRLRLRCRRVPGVL